MGRSRSWLILFAFGTLMVVMNWVRFVSDELAHGGSGKFLHYFIMETTGVYTLFILVPLVFWFFKRMQVSRKNFFRFLPLHLLCSMVFGVCHTLLMCCSRALIYWLFKIGTYDYGVLAYRILMEYGHQLFTYFFILGLFCLLKYIGESQQQKMRTVELEQELTRARLQTLKMQLNPHFFFNTLNMISSTMYEDIQAADKMIAKLSDLLRKTLRDEDTECHTLSEEMELLRLYVDILKSRFKDNLTVSFEVNQELMPVMIPRFIMQPLVENTVKHGMDGGHQTAVRIIGQREGHMLSLSVVDNGPGISGNTEGQYHQGTGLANTAGRLEKLYGSQHSFELRNLPEGGLRVNIKIPFTDMNEVEIHG